MYSIIGIHCGKLCLVETVDTLFDADKALTSYIETHDATWVFTVEVNR